MRKVICCLTIACVLALPLSGCSQPIDNGSSVPAASQPIVALLALVGVGIALTAYHHHNEHRGGGPGVTITPQMNIIGPLISGSHATDLAFDPVNLGIGVLEVPNASGLTSFALITGGSFLSYTLPSGYSPIAMSVDTQNGVDWFVDSTGKVQGCLAPVAGVTTCTTTSLPVPVFHDGLGTGPRSIAVDQFFVFVAKDGGAGAVNWFAGNLNDGTTTTSSYRSQSTATLYSADTAISTPQSASAFTVFHSDGKSDLVSIPPAVAPSFTYSPIPLLAPSNNVPALDGVNRAFFALTGSVGGTYQITRYTNSFNAGTGPLKTQSIIIANNGQTGDTANPWTLPLSSLHADPQDQLLVGIDGSGNIIEFAEF